MGTAPHPVTGTTLCHPLEILVWIGETPSPTETQQKLNQKFNFEAQEARCSYGVLNACTFIAWSDAEMFIYLFISS